METLTPADVRGLKSNHGTLTVFTNENGGIKDDLIVTKTDKDYLYVVTNAGCIGTDVPHMQVQYSTLLFLCSRFQALSKIYSCYMNF